MAWASKKRQGGRVTLAEAQRKLERYCAYQDRCHQEVKRKLYDLGLFPSEVEEVLCQLIEDRFVDEERFARSYARGKFRMKSWGRVRITRELKQRQLSPYCIKAGLSEIEEVDYQDTLNKLLEKRLQKQDPKQTTYVRRQDLISYGLRKGYELDLLLEVSKALVAEVGRIG